MKIIFEEGEWINGVGLANRRMATALMMASHATAIVNGQTVVVKSRHPIGANSRPSVGCPQFVERMGEKVGLEIYFWAERRGADILATSADAIARSAIEKEGVDAARVFIQIASSIKDVDQSLMASVSRAMRSADGILADIQSEWASESGISPPAKPGDIVTWDSRPDLGRMRVFHFAHPAMLCACEEDKYDGIIGAPQASYKLGVDLFHVPWEDATLVENRSSAPLFGTFLSLPPEKTENMVAGIDLTTMRIANPGGGVSFVPSWRCYLKRINPEAGIIESGEDLVAERIGPNLDVQDVVSRILLEGAGGDEG